MKKVSTVAAKQTKNFAEQKLTIGLDLGDRSSWYCVLDEAGDVLLEQKLGTTPKAMKEVFGKMPRSRIALETGMHSPWVSRGLSELGHEVIVAHARNVRLIGESRRKDDRFDARTLARLARIDPQLLAPVQHRSAEAQAHLMVIRARAGLVRARTSLINTARGLTKFRGQNVEVLAALALARIGDASKARALVEELEKRYPSDTLLRLYWLPTIKAAIELRKGNSSQAIVDLESAIPYELTQGGNLDPAYERCQAYLLAHNGTAAVVEFRKLLDHPGIVQNDITGAIARLKIGHAYALSGDSFRAKAAYRDFLTLWRDADPDVPILKEAKAEYAKLQ